MLALAESAERLNAECDRRVPASDLALRDAERNLIHAARAVVAAATAETPPTRRCWLCLHPVTRSAACAVCGCLAHYPAPPARCHVVGCNHHVEGSHTDYRGDAIIHIGCDGCAETPPTPKATTALRVAARHPHKGPKDTDATMLREAAERAAAGYAVGGSNTQATVARVLGVVADLIEADQ